MRKTLSAGLALAILVACGRAVAEPPLLDRIPADATWLVHFDVDALKQSTAAQRLSDRALENPELRRALRWLAETLGTDPARDLHGATFYGRRLGSPDSAVLAVHAALDRPRLLKLVASLPEYRTETYQSHQVHTWRQVGGAHDGKPMNGCIVDARRLLFAQEIDVLRAALDVIDGRAPALPADSPLRVEAPPGTALYVAAMDLAEVALPLRSPITRQSERLTVVLGEHQGEVFFEARLVARSDEAAEQILSVAEGFRALAILQAGADPQVRRWLDTVKLARRERAVEAAGRMPAASLLKWIETLAEQETP